MVIQWWLLTLIVGGVILFLGGLTAFVIFLIRRAMRGGIRVVVFFADGTQEIKKFRKLDDKFTIDHNNGKSCKYIFDYKLIKKTKNRDYIYYNYVFRVVSI